MSEHEYPVHSVAALFPMMTGDEFEAFKADIAEHGQREDIILWRGMVIDGRNRLEACRQLGIEPQFCEMDESADPVSRIISLNLHRRQLTESQRSMVAAGLANLKPGKPTTDNPQICGITQEQAADSLKTSVRSVQAAKVVIEGACPEIIDMVTNGDLKVSLAEKLVRTKAEDWHQRELARQGVVAIREFVKKRELEEADKQRSRDAAAEFLEANTIPTPATKAQPNASTKPAEAAAPAHVPPSTKNKMSPFDTKAFKALQLAPRPDLVIEKWLRDASKAEVSAIWSIVDELLSDANGGQR